MEKDNKETIFEIITIGTIIAGAYSNNKYVIIVAVISLSASLWFWYGNNITNPIQTITSETKELRKDLNMRKELEGIKMKLEILNMQMKQKRASINPFLFIIILLLIVMLIMYLKDKGII